MGVIRLHECATAPPHKDKPLTANDAYVSDYADELIATPRAHLRLDLAQDEGAASRSPTRAESWRAASSPRTA